MPAFHLFVLALAALSLSIMAASRTSAQEAPVVPTGPGAFEVDPEAAERALELTLVARGQLLLRPGQFEIEPSIGYEHLDRVRGIALAFVDGDRPVVIETLRARRDRVTAAVDARVGLPFDSQFELRLPLVYVRERIDQPLAGISRSDSTTGAGDIRVGFAKTLLRERGPVPDLVARIAWDTASGRDRDTLSLTSGFHEFVGSLSALKRLDPLVVTAGASYQISLERNGINPGDVFGFNIGTTLAASPTTALSLGFSAAFRQRQEVDGMAIAGTDTNEAYLNFGISNVIRRNTLLSVNFGAGLTEDSTDYFVSASLPIRFSLR